MPRTVAFCTLGCKVNQYDSQAMLEQFERAGYQAAPFSDIADVYVVNTCTVTGTGDKKSRQMIRRAARLNPEAAVVVTGCMAQRAAEDLAALEGVKLVLGTQRRGEIVQLLEKALTQPSPLIAVQPLENALFEPLTVRRSEGRTRATLKIQEGCQNHCAYCIIPSVRGPIRSRPLKEICDEAARLAEAGFQEVVVTGIHLSSYGKDMQSGTTLMDVLAVLQAQAGIQRIRLGSLEPRIITEAFAADLSKMDKLCPQFMLALQSGSDTVLARMRRRYTTAQYADAVKILRSVYPHMALTSDVMVGFPGETDEEFAQTWAFVEAMGFARIHVFPYSRRVGTNADKMPGQLPKDVKDRRAAALIALGNRLERAYMQSWVGQEADVLLEEPCQGGICGYTPEYIRVVAPDGEGGRIQRVRLTGIHEDGELSMMGERA